MADDNISIAAKMSAEQIRRAGFAGCVLPDTWGVLVAGPVLKSARLVRFRASSTTGLQEFTGEQR